MPYRSELKRPDLKGQFPCTVCGKIFCHSSSLSRHRMQAHFKSFTCTQCNKEISSSETLRSHMFRAHSISRMFMCRCCNWAFPDKTSLHIHMQSMARTGHPGDVAVLARSSTEIGPEESPSQEMNCSSPGSRTESRNSASPEQNSPPRYANNNNNNNDNNSKNSNFLQRSIFPTLASERSDLLSTLSASNNDSANQWLSLWLANNPLSTNSPLSVTLNDISASLLASGQTQLGSTGTERESSCADVDNASENNGSSLYDEIRNDSPMETVSEACAVAGDLAKNDGSSRNKRKSRRPMQLSSLHMAGNPDAAPNTLLDFAEADYQPPCKVTVTSEDGKELSGQSSSAEQPSPTVSDSHTSGSSTQGSGLVSPKKCFECHETSSHYESEIQQLRSQLNEELQKRTNCDKCDVAHERIDHIQKQVGVIMAAIGGQNNFPSEIRHLLDELSQIAAV
uniref:C2H2-type domain-containing protein n=1 Tax=Steinernema glaseri TaxID=37863 RepID=A0A1I7Z393_9BILA